MYGSEPGCAQPPLLRWGVDNTQHAGSIILSQIPGITKVILAAVSSLLGSLKGIYLSFHCSKGQSLDNISLHEPGSK